MFEDFINNARTDIYHLVCSIFARDKQQTLYDNDEISIVDRPIPKNATTKLLEALGATLNFIGCWIRLFYHNYEVIWKFIMKL